MKPKRTARLLARLKSPAPRITPKKPGPKKVRLAGSRALAAAAKDDYWQIEITVRSATGNDLAWISLRPPAPPPPIEPNGVIAWVRQQLGS